MHGACFESEYLLRSYDNRKKLGSLMTCPGHRCVRSQSGLVKIGDGVAVGAGVLMDVVGMVAVGADEVVVVDLDLMIEVVLDLVVGEEHVVVVELKLEVVVE